MTQNELFEIYIKEEWYEIFTFEEFEKHYNKVMEKVKNEKLRTDDTI